MLHIFFNEKLKIQPMIFLNVTFHDQNRYSEGKSPVIYHLKTNFLHRNIFPVNLQNFIKLCVFYTNVATDLKNYKLHSDLIRITQA